VALEQPHHGDEHRIALASISATERRPPAFTAFNESMLERFVPARKFRSVQGNSSVGSNCLMKSPCRPAAGKMMGHERSIKASEGRRNR
jgi:hypothetical protein